MLRRDARFVGKHLAQQSPGPIRAAVVDEDKLQLASAIPCRPYGYQPLLQLCHPGLLVEDRNDYRYKLACGIHGHTGI